jgi:hypothetical protein
MRPADVSRVLGTDQRYEEWMGGNLNDFMFYGDILIGFNGENADSPGESSEVVMFELNGSQPLSFHGEPADISSKGNLLFFLKARELQFLEKPANIIRVQDLGLQFTFSEDQQLTRIYLQRCHG